LTNRPRSLSLALLVVLIAALASTAAASGKPRRYHEPPIAVPGSELSAAFHCHGEVEDSSVQPLLLVTGTGSTGEAAYIFTHGAFEALGRPVCDVDFPEHTTADIQVSVQYLVYAIRREYRMAERPIAILGISQGGLLPRIALTYWPRLRRMVTDVVAAAGTQHGTTIGAGSCSAANPCPPAAWQQGAGSNLLRVLNRQPFEAPRPTSWTTVRSATDETVQPQTGKHPTSALRGAANILIQSVCPGRSTTHVGTLVDSVTFAALADAISHKGAAKASRLPGDVCSHPYATGLNEEQTTKLLEFSTSVVGAEAVPTVSTEPLVRGWFKRRAPG
jgi:hypothetical protein